MSIGTGTHWEGPLLGSRGNYEDVPAQVQSQRNHAVMFFDFMEPLALTSFVATNITSGTGAIVNGIGGLARLNATAANQGIGSFQSGVGAWFPSAATPADASLLRHTISFGARVRINDWSNCDWFVGMSGFDTTFMDATGVLLTTGGDDHVGFHHLVTDGNDVRLSSAGTAVANTQVTLLSAANQPRPLPADAAVDSVWHEFGFRLRGLNQVEFYLDGVLRHRRTMGVNLANVAWVLQFAMIANGAVINFDIDHCWAAQTRQA